MIDKRLLKGIDKRLLKDVLTIKKVADKNDYGDEVYSEPLTIKNVRFDRSVGDLVIVTQKLVQEIQNQGKNKGLYTSIPRYLL